ncbi:MAG: MBL fold metallo-hydrolase [Chloroflexota bacterium]|nr:MBL fold metallo-hydrolase [Chloroflexota bacterium]
MSNPSRICKDIYLIGDADISHPYDCCVYLLDAGDLVLIDSGAGKSFDRLVSNIEKLGFDPNKLTSVIATHAHIDHIGSLHQFQDVFSAQIIAHELDADAIEAGKGIAAEAYGIAYTPCHIDCRLKGSEETLQFARYELKTIHIPGHTPGSIALYLDIDNERVLFGQDIHGPYFPGWGADPIQAKQSLSRLLALKADILCEGHFGIYQPAKAVESYIKEYRDSL